MNHKRREFIKNSAFGAAALGFAASQPLFAESDEKPNIIYILADDLGYHDLGCYGQEKFATPNIDAMAREGMRFTDHYAGSAVCAPSRCTLMTGKHTGRCHVRGNREVLPEGQEPLPKDAKTVASYLKNAGYKTGVIGKWGLGAPGTDGVPNKQGFDYFFGYNCQRQAHHYYPEYLWRNDEKVFYPENKDGAKGTYSHDEMTREALEFVKRESENPFFLYLAYTIPHADLDVPEDSMERYEGTFPEEPFPGGGYLAQKTPNAAFAGMIGRMDRDVGKLRGLLKELGLEENTLIVFSSDNGPHWEGGKDPRYFDSSFPFRGEKAEFSEGGIRVPMIALWPGKIKKNSVSSHVSAFWDFLPTALQAAGAKVPADIDGISFLPELLGEGEQKKHEYLYWELNWGGLTSMTAVRAGDWKAVRNNRLDNSRQAIRLYNLKSDPGEKYNLSYVYRDKVNELTRKMGEAHIPSDLFPLPQDLKVVDHLGRGKKAILTNGPSDKFSKGSVFLLTDGRTGGLDLGTGWLAFEENDLEAVVDLGSVSDVSMVGANFLQDQGSWIFSPEVIRIDISEDGNNYKNVINRKEEPYKKSRKKRIEKRMFYFQKERARFVRIYGKNAGKCPSWHKGAGGKAWLFIDEIIVN